MTIKFSKIFDKQIKNITSAAAIIATASLLSRVLGLVRDRVLASQFGASDLSDAYFAAFRIPDFIYNLIVVGAISAGFIPIFSQFFHKDTKKSNLSLQKKEEAWRFTNTVLNILLIVFIVIGIVFFCFTTPIIRLITPGFNETKLAITVTLTRIMFFSQLLFALSSIFGAILQSFRRFIVYSIAPILYNIGIIFGVWFLVPNYGVNGVAIGVVTGAFLHMIVQYFVAVKLGFRYKFIIKFSKDVIKLLTLMVPRTLSLAVTQLNIFAVTILVSFLPTGSLTAFTYANNLIHFPIGIFGISFAVAAFPSFSQYVNNKDSKGLIKSFVTTSSKILFFLIPITFIFILLDDQLVRVIFGSGEFNWEDTILTAKTFMFLSLSLCSQGLIPLFTRLFYAFKNTYYPLIGAVLNFIIALISGYYFSKEFGLIGIALGFSLGSVINYGFLLFIIHKKVLLFPLKEISYQIMKILTASLFMGVTIQFMKHVMGKQDILNNQAILDLKTFVGIFLHGFIPGITGLLVFILFCHWLKVNEYMDLLKFFKKKIINPAKKLLPIISLGDEDNSIQ